MFYKYDDKQLMFVKNKLGVKIALGTTVLLMVGSFFIGRHFQSDTLDTIENKIKIINLQKEKEKFHPELMTPKQQKQALVELDKLIETEENKLKELKRKKQETTQITKNQQLNG